VTSGGVSLARWRAAIECLQSGYSGY
jgi:hypothetical protein